MVVTKQRGFLTLMDNLRSKLTWRDVLVGFCAAVVISATLIGFRYPSIPEYRVGQISAADVRTGQDVVYEDTAATDIRRAEAEAGVPALYQLESGLIDSQEKTISRAFSDARAILQESGIIPEAKLSKAAESGLLKKLEARVGRTLSPQILPILLRQRFNADLEGRLVKIFDTVLRDGIVADRAQFLKDQRAGIVTRDGPFGAERPLSDSYIARDIAAAREHLGKLSEGLPGLSRRDRRILAQSLETALSPTLVYNREETVSRRAMASSRVAPVMARIKRGQVIVRSGEHVTQNIFMQLDALRNMRHASSLVRQYGGYFLFAAILAYTLWRYLALYQSRHRKIRKHTVLILTIVATELVTVRLATALADILGEQFPRFHDPSVLYYGIPFAFGALLVTLLVDVNLGIMTAMILSVLVGLFYGDVNLAVYLLIGSLAGIYSIRQYKDRAAILKAGLTIGIVNIVCIAGLDILHQVAQHLSDVLDQIVLALLGGILASAVASILLPALEALFKVVTDIRLLEMSNLNAPVLRRLSVEAPGTYHHSLMVATLAEDAAESVGANPLLARVAAYYHDIGKILNPEFFVENESDAGSRHERLTPRESCSIISSHVREGLRLALEAGVPQRISDIIPQHHGTRIMTYFYKKALEMGSGDSQVEEADFRYPGPKPQRKEAAIIMMADSVEAASKTLDDPTPQQIQGMISRLVDEIVNDNQFDDCDITFRDVQRIKESFFKILTGIFHHRIDYPGYDFKNVGEESGNASGRNTGPEPAKTV